VRLKNARTKEDALAVAERMMRLRKESSLSPEMRLLVSEVAEKAISSGEELKTQADAATAAAAARQEAPGAAPKGDSSGGFVAALGRMFSSSEPEPEPEPQPRLPPRPAASARNSPSSQPTAKSAAASAAEKRQRAAAARGARPRSAGAAPEGRPPWNSGGGAKPAPRQTPRKAGAKPRGAAGGSRPAPGAAPGATPGARGADKQKSEYAARIESEIVDSGPPVMFDDIAGLEDAKRVLQEMVIMPQLRPDLFTGLRAPPRGVLLFGPPGTGKTMLAKAVACQSNATFFSISAASLTGRWVGESEGMVRAMFEVARSRQPAFIFIDEVDSLLSERGGGNEGEASRKLKTEFLVQFDGVSSGDATQLTVMGATNRPQEIDEAARRRFVKRIYISLPDKNGRLQLLDSLLSKHKVTMSKKGNVCPVAAVPAYVFDRPACCSYFAFLVACWVHHMVGAAEREKIAARTLNFSGADLRALCGDAAMGPIRELPPDQIQTIDVAAVRPVNYKDLLEACERTRPSVGAAQVADLESWNQEFGSFASQ
jgi:hypothetical protein